MNDTEASSTNDWDTRLGLSSLCAALYRFKKPRDVAQRQLWRRLAIETVDQWFTNQQDPVTGGMWRTSVANVANDSGTICWFGLAQVAIVAKCLNLRTRWATQIADAVDYNTSNFDNNYYTNGNIMFLKLVGYELAAWATGDAARRTVVENLWTFTYYPNAVATAQGLPLRWRGCGFVDDGDGRGYFSEVTNTGYEVDHSAANVLDWIYTDAQANYSILGYVLYGDERYATAARACTLKMAERYNYVVNQFVTTGGSRNPGVSQRNITGPNHMALGWIDGDADLADKCSGIINTAVNGVDADFRLYLNASHTVYLRSFGLVVGFAIIAAHGKTFS
jgi:hypothetical protein